MTNVSGLALTLLAQASPAATEAVEVVEEAGLSTPTESSAMGWLALLVLAAIVFLPFVIGGLVERWLKMKDIAFRVGVTIFSLVLGIAPFVENYRTTGHVFEGAIPLGIDLAGGTNLVYRVDQDAVKALGKTVDAGTMQKMRDKVQLRVNPSGTEEVTVRVVGTDRIEVIVPGADEARTQQIKNRITNLGSLEFSVVVNQREHPELYEIGSRQLTTPEVKSIERGGKVLARWVPIAFDSTGKPKLEGVSSGELMRAATVQGKPGFEVLCVNEPDLSKRITGDYLVSAREEFQQGEQVVSFTFNQAGGYLFQNLTWKYQPREGDPHRTKLAILLSDLVHSAPNINDVISTQGQISGNFTAAEIEELTSVLNSGALDVPLITKPVSEFTVSPLLGLDVREKGMTSMIIAVIGVFLVTVLYYWKAGIVADICLAINIILTMGVLSLIDATFTLPGLAGLVLSIGMAVDTNVLIFERMREELARGASLRMAINNGFHKALSTIIDSNVTTLITTVVLYVIGTDAVRGFAVTLFIGIVCSVFSAVYVGRLLFDIIERKKLFSTLPMAQLVPASNFDFVGKTRLCLVFSVGLIAAGLAGVWYRGAENLDIDFTGGAMVTFDFEAPQPGIDVVRTRLIEKFGDDITVEQLSLGATDDGTPAETLVRLRTSVQDEDEVSRLITEAFAGSEYQLVRQHVQLGQISEIPAAAAADGASAGDDDFSGGRRAEITLERESLASTVKEDLLSALAKLDSARFEGAETVLRVTAESTGETANANKFAVEVKPAVDAATLQAALDAFKVKLEADPHFVEKNTFQSSVGDEMKISAILAITISMAAIILYLWFRFQGVYFGVAAVIALLHDILIVLGLVALGSLLSGNSIGQIFQLTDFKINLTMVAAFLTIMGYSLNDTIVIFDRIREVRGKNPRLTHQMVNDSVNQTLSRTLVTSMTTLLVIMIMYVMGGEGIHGFAYCLFLGIVVGTYSSIYVASPVLLWLANREQAKTAKSAAT